MDQVVALVLVLAVLIVLARLLVPRRSARGSSPAQARPRPGARQGAASERVLEQKLLNMTLGNRGAIERGVAAKRRQHPQASRAELLELVHDDYVRDRSR